MIRNWVIYKILSPTNKVYIGVTSNYKKRYAYYKNNNISGQKKLFASFNKHGFYNHSFEVIDTLVGTLSQALSKEMFWIRTYMSNCVKYPEMNGMNLTDGGQGTIGYKASDELKKRLSDYHKKNPSRGMKGKKLSAESIAKGQATRIANLIAKGEYRPPIVKTKANKEETRLKQSLAKKGKPAHNKGKPMPEHQKELLRKINTGRPSWNKGKNYSHLSEEERKIKYGSHNIGNSYNKGRKHSAIFCEQMSKIRKGKSNPYLWKKILRYNNQGELIGVYKSIKECSSKSGYSCWTIGNICKGLRKTKSVSIFKYA